jgi:hypothetical protein
MPVIGIGRHAARQLPVTLRRNGQPSPRAIDLQARLIELTRLWRDRGKPQQARELLAPVYGWFTKGFDTRDLKEAKALPEELAA